MIHKDLITFLTSTGYAAKDIAALIGKRCHYGMVPTNQANILPRVFLIRSSHERFGELDGTAALITDYFNVEVISDQSTDVDNLCDKFWSDVHLHYGNITSDVSVKGIFLETQSDDYEPKGIGSDIGLDVASFNMRVVYTT